MRTVSIGVRRGMALLALLLVFAAPAAYADNSNPYEPPQARIKPPIGEPTAARIKPPGGEPTVDARIKPPTGEPAPDSRIKPPSGEPGIFELFADWLDALARIHPPIG